ncbi:TniQ family protein [Aliagarivorans taiwanensis]|uniref:TniQ family protein n=1 Tax=Aliagarivorans taiwanensis TaxID=561966 RepID=UPI000407D769|nr:TniQ family protein [Aliagarivorans taiwanensis]
MRNRYLPSLLPHEHVLSVLARWFDVSGRNDFLNTVRAVSNNVNSLSPMAVWRPVYWDLSRQFIETLGWENVIGQHTLFPYYAPFLRQLDRNLLLSGDESLASIRIKPVQQNLIKHAQHWRWCQSCAEEDYEQYGTSYWHTYHQLPSALTCYRHNALLLFQCTRCGFKYSHFQRHWLPPIDGRCRECSEQISPASMEIPPFIHWLDTASYYLQQCGSKVENEPLIKAMREKLGYEMLPQHLSVPLRAEITQQQRDFEAWLPELVIRNFFNRSCDKLFDGTNQVLRLSAVAYRARIAPPVSVLMMLNYLELESVFDDLLA